MGFCAIFLTFSVGCLFGVERMNVSVCNLGNLSEALVAQAEVEAAHVFRTIGIEVVWAKCGDEVGPGASDVESRFMIRLRNDRPPETWGPVSLDLMGRAYVKAPGEGRMADVFFKMVSAFADRHQTGAEVLLGCVIAHEIGHLLLGPGHSTSGIMRSPWRSSDTIALNRRWLQFTGPQRAEILLRLRDINRERPNR
jgi:hypothetical protein